MTEGKQLFFLTATPINNSLYDLMHLIEYFSRKQPDYFGAAPLGIHSLRGHIKRMETALESILGNELAADVEMDVVTAEEVLSRDDLFQALVVQRSRAYVKRSLKQEGGQSVFFPVRKDPRVANYSLEKTYGDLLDKLADAFNKDKPLVSLVIYNPYEHYIGSEPVDEFIVGRQTQVVGLIRTLLLKRFESSVKAFEASCEDLLLKLLYFVELHSEKNPKTVQRWKDQHKKLLDHIKEDLITRGLHEIDEEDLDEDIVPEEFKKKIEKLDEKTFNISAMVTDTLMDMNQLVLFLNELKEIDARHDDKLQALIELLKTDTVLKKNKVLVFTEYKATARYIHRHLTEAKIEPLMQVDSQKHNAREAVHLFSPYYNNSSSEEIKEKGKQEIRVLVSTDILAEGLNLQDATCIINYDLHWNPVRLMQRIGRVDRRLDKQIEDKILADHPQLKDVRGTVHLWNFLPPDELNKILSLYERVTHKTLRISKTFGIEGKKLLTPEDDYDTLREFNEKYEGTTTSTEEMYLKYQQLLQDHPQLVDEMRSMPKRLFSGKKQIKEDTKGVFFCYRLPDKDSETGEWTDDASFTRWYFYNIKTEEISENTTQIHKMIESSPDTPRITTTLKKDLSEIRRKLDKHIKDSYLKKVQAPAEVEPTLLAWMDIV
jgi:superfamily II DNA/RNA helicase